AIHSNNPKKNKPRMYSHYWSEPSMNEYVSKVVAAYQTCQKFHPALPKETLEQDTTVTTAWGTIGVDMSTLEGKEYLAIIDAYSNYPEVVKLKHTISEEVYRKLKPIFCRYGIPSTVRTDNGPQSIGKDFVKFKEELGFKHITSSPKYPQSNGLAECGVKTVKHLLKKAMYSGEDPQIALLNYRATALEGGKSPAELLFGRQLSTKL
uniref:Integrase catalytic domain-containing protein n=1 Tax=Latimeria chalumnae TaxID=7897 RepID=H3A6G5_LATCH